MRNRDRVNTNRTESGPGYCLARSADGRPAMLYVESEDATSAGVKPGPGDYDRPLWIPRECVYRPDPELYASLLRAYQGKDGAKCKELWSRARPWGGTDGL